MIEVAIASVEGVLDWRAYQKEMRGEADSEDEEAVDEDSDYEDDAYEDDDLRDYE